MSNLQLQVQDSNLNLIKPKDIAEAYNETLLKSLGLMHSRTRGEIREASDQFESSRQHVSKPNRRQSIYGSDTGMKPSNYKKSEFSSEKDPKYKSKLKIPSISPNSGQPAPMIVISGKNSQEKQHQQLVYDKSMLMSHNPKLDNMNQHTPLSKQRHSGCHSRKSSVSQKQKKFISQKDLNVYSRRGSADRHSHCGDPKPTEREAGHSLGRRQSNSRKKKDFLDQ